MFFYNKKLLREAGYDDAFIEAMPERTLTGDLTMDELIDIAKQVVDKTDAQYGILHRPNKGPDYIMVFQAYGNSFVDPASGNLLLERDKLAAAFGWFERGVKEGVIPANNTAMEFDALRKEFYTRQRRVLDVRHLGPRHLRLPDLRAAERRGRFFARTGAGSPHPPAEKGGSAEQPDPSRRLCGRRRRGGSRSSPSGCSATPRTPTSTPITRSPRRISASSPSSSRTRATRRPGRWPGRRSFLKITKFLPNNPQFGDLNGIIYTAIQGVESGRLTGEEAADFVIDEATASLEDVIVK